MQVNIHPSSCAQGCNEVGIAGRRPDPCVPLAGRIDGYDQEFLQAIDTAMQIHPKDRLQTATKWKSLIADTTAETTHNQTRARVSIKDISFELELSLTRLVKETNNEARRTSQLPVEPETIIAFPENLRNRSGSRNSIKCR